MRFDRDARKSERNLADRGFDFEFATQLFDGRTLERDDTRHDYGERRIVAVGWLRTLRSPWCTPTASSPAARSFDASFRLE